MNSIDRMIHKANNIKSDMCESGLVVLEMASTKQGNHFSVINHSNDECLVFDTKDAQIEYARSIPHSIVIDMGDSGLTLDSIAN